MLIVEDEPYMAEAIRDGLRLEAIAADIAGDGDTALELLSANAYDIAVLDRDIPGPTGDQIAERIVASGSGMPILMLTAADRLDDKASGFELGADDYLTKPFELRELVLRLRALDRRRAHNRPPVRKLAGLRLDPFRREVYRDGRYVALTRKQFAVLEILVAAEGGVVSAELEPGGLVVETVGSREHEDRHAAAGSDDAFGDLVSGGSGYVTVEDGDVVVVDAQQLESRVAVTGNVCRDRFQA